MISRRMIVAGIAAGPVFLTADNPAEAAPALPSPADFARGSSLRDAALSPDGERIALLREQFEGGKRLAYVNIIKASAPRDPPARVILGDIDSQGVTWVSNDRLLVWLSIERSLGTDSQIGSHFTTSYRRRIRRVMTVNADGSNPIFMFADQRTILYVNDDLGIVVDWLPDDPDHILMQVFDGVIGRWTLHKVDVVTGRSDRVEIGSDSTGGWTTRDGVPVLRHDYNSAGTIMSLYARGEANAPWKFVRKIRRSEIFRPDFDLVGFTEEPAVFLALCNPPDAPRATVRKFNILTLEFGDVVFAHAERDIEGVVTDRRWRVLAAEYSEDRHAYIFADTSYAPHFRGLARYFENECNVRLMETDATGKRLLLHVSGPRVSGAYFYYDKATAHLEVVGEARPWLTPNLLAKVEPTDVRTRDGVTLRAYVTVPQAAGPRPLIVMPHGGPEVRDIQDFDLVAQTFAAQGWMVVQPNFRGSGGYGTAFAHSGYRHWGDRMQEDVEDACDQLIASGRVDRDRVAIWGASYGGYAALMGGMRRPDLYKAVVAQAGVSDLIAMINRDRAADDADALIANLWVARVGDPRTDEDMLKAASPRFHADRFKAPVLLLHGGRDNNVSPEQSKMMQDALKSAGKPVRYVELTGEGHSGFEPATMKIILETSTAFIADAFAKFRPA